MEKITCNICTGNADVTYGNFELYIDEVEKELDIYWDAGYGGSDSAHYKIKYCPFCGKKLGE